MRAPGCADVGRPRREVRPRWRLTIAACAAATFLILVPSAALASGGFPARGELDCNGVSTVQKPVRQSMNCTDIRGVAGVDNANVWNSRFYDNGTYIGHDEPDMTFLSSRPGTGNNVTWTERIPSDPSALPTSTNPGHDVTHWFELSPAPWFSMAMCDPNSYPGNSCTPQSDANAPSPSCLGPNPCTGYTGGGSAFMEMQFYPPGDPPFVDSISCDDSHWCAALTIDSLECRGFGFPSCNSACEEPVNFAYIQRDGVPTGPAAPQASDLQSFTPNRQTLLMSPGDVVRVHMYDAPVPGGRGQRAFEVVVDDLTTHQSGWMQASAANGFATSSFTTCANTPFNFQPEYNTAQKNNIVPWAALQTNISTEFETGHWISCSTVAGGPVTFNLSSTITDATYTQCQGLYEASAPGGDGGSTSEPTDAYCYPAGDTHGALNTAPDLATGCEDNVTQNGDLDFDGNPYWADWPVGPNPTYNTAGSFLQAPPTSGPGTGGRAAGGPGGANGQYSQFFIQTDVALSESTCAGPAGPGCAAPPPNAPGHFYPYWSETGGPGGCVIEFGNVHGPGVNDFGGDAQYGTDQFTAYGYPAFEGPVMNNTCGGRGGNHRR
ncbi:MAG TPA: hypothetical protein VFN87_11640 [Solirubrobacteraceae bacterium]|nr:hypothetical protein [Solirubrobacteraceae bacterium]